MIRKDATVPDGTMANERGTIGQIIHDQLTSFREDVREDIRDIKESVKDVKENVREVANNVDDIKEDLGGRGGIRERLTALEVQMKQALDSAPTSSYPPPVKAKKRSIKDHAPALGAGAGGAGLLYALIELANTFLKTK